MFRLAKLVALCIGLFSITVELVSIAGRASTPPGNYNCLRLYDEIEPPMPNTRAMRDAAGPQPVLWGVDAGALLDVTTGSRIPIRRTTLGMELEYETASPDRPIMYFQYSDQTNQKSVYYLLMPGMVKPISLGSTLEIGGWSNNGNFIYTTREDESLHVRIFDVQHYQFWELTHFAPVKDMRYSTLWSPNGDYAAIVGVNLFGTTMQIWSIAQKLSVKAFNTNSVHWNMGSWSPNGQHIIYPRKESPGVYALYLTSLNSDENIKLPITWAENTDNYAVAFDDIKWIGNQYFMYGKGGGQNITEFRFFDTSGTELHLGSPDQLIGYIWPTADPHVLWAREATQDNYHRLNPVPTLLQLTLQDGQIKSQTLTTRLDTWSGWPVVDAKGQRIAFVMRYPDGPRLGIVGLDGSYHLSRALTLGYIEKLTWLGDYIDAFHEDRRRAWYKPDGTPLAIQPLTIDGDLVLPTDVNTIDGDPIILYAFPQGNAGGKGFNYLWNGESGNLRRLNDVPDYRASTVISAPDGSRSATMIGQTLYTFAANSSEIKQFPNTFPRTFNYLGWVPCYRADQ